MEHELKSPSDPWGHVPFDIPGERFDQKNEMFKRSISDPQMLHLGERYWREVRFLDRAGYRKLDYALRNASSNVERSFARGNARGNSGMYAWEGVPDRVKPYLEEGGPVEGSPGELAAAVKHAAGFFGADLTGVCRVHPNWVYSHEFNTIDKEHYPIELPEGCDNAVVLAVAMDYEAIASAPTCIGSAGTGLGYSKMAAVANLVALFIRGLGYRAIPCGNDTALSVPLALAAGIGEQSRMGIVVTEQFGPRVRLCKVFTDMPLATDRYRPFGVKEFCESCKKCAKRCPSQAISHGERTTEGVNRSNQSGPRKWYVDGEKCFSFWAQNRADCSVCIRVCPYNKPPGILHNLVRKVIRRAPALHGTILRIDDLLGYGNQRDPRTFWGRP